METSWNGSLNESRQVKNGKVDLWISVIVWWFKWSLSRWDDPRKDVEGGKNIKNVFLWVILASINPFLEPKFDTENLGFFITPAVT